MNCSLSAFDIELRIPPLSEVFDVWGVHILYSNNVIYITLLMKVFYYRLL